MNRSRAVLAVMLAGAGTASAQDSATTHAICMTAEPAPRCSAILLTNLGVHAFAGGAEHSGAAVRVMTDWGLLVTASRHVALGASWLLSVDRDGLLSGPMLRARIWPNDSTSWEVGLGHGVAHNGDNALGTFGLIKWNPAPSVGLSLRPEWRQHTTYDCQSAPPYTCAPTSHGTFAVSAGVELGGVGGLIGSLSSAAAGMVVLLAYLSSDD